MIEAAKKPFRVAARVFVWLVQLPREQMRNLFSLAMLAGIIALTLTNNFFLFIAKGAIGRNETVWYGILFEQLRFNNYLIGWFAGIIGLLVFGADYIRGKIAGYELGFGKGGEPAASMHTERKETVEQPPPPPPAVVSGQDMEKARADMAAEQGEEIK
jgi:hypothetical protein